MSQTSIDRLDHQVLSLTRADLSFLSDRLYSRAVSSVDTCGFRLMPDGDSDVKPDTIPRRCRTRFRREAGRHSELKPDIHR